MPHTRIRRFLKHGTLPQLALFEASARLGSLSRAAEELHMAQPTASVQIKKLTDTIGLPLFEQVGRRLHLTDTGRAVRASCRELFGVLDRLDEALNDARGLRCGCLRLAVSTAAKDFAPRLLARFAQRHPGIELSLQIHNRQSLIARLSENLDDLYLFAEAPGEPDLIRQSILANPLVVVAHASHPLARESRIPFERLAEEPFLMREPGSGTRMIAQRLFDAHGSAPRIRMELSNNEAIRSAVGASLGVSILPRFTFAGAPEPTPLVCLDVEGFPIENHWYFVYPSGKQLSVVARAFMDLVRAEAETLASDERLHSSIPALRDSVGALLSHGSRARPSLDYCDM